MGTTAVKLQAALDSKEAIRQAIIAKEVEVPPETPLSQYPDKIAEIEGGGGVVRLPTGEQVEHILFLIKEDFENLLIKDSKTLYIVA
jgi:hypothetical protein